MGELRYEALSESIIGAAMSVLNELKPGLSEKVYENALVIELLERGASGRDAEAISGALQRPLVGTFVPDLIVDELVVADPKAVKAFNDEHLAQMLGYLAITNLKLALLLNFKYSKLQWKRVVK